MKKRSKTDSKNKQIKVKPSQPISHPNRSSTQPTAI